MQAIAPLLGGRAVSAFHLHLVYHQRGGSDRSGSVFNQMERQLASQWHRRQRYGC
jgi:hypothetical protein